MWQGHKGAVGQLQGVSPAAAGLVGILPHPQWEAPGDRGDIQACLGGVAGLVPNHAIKGVTQIFCFPSACKNYAYIILC